MKIGLIADVHADLPSLRRALDILDGQGVQQVVCAGDLVGKGLDGDAVVRLLRERDIPCVLGNHDADAEQNNAWLSRRYGRDHAMILDAETAQYTARLPDHLRFEWAGLRAYMTHGTPWSNLDYLFPFSKTETFRQVVTAAQSDLIILGHTHAPMLAQVGAAWVVNSGSVCGERSDGSSTCAVVTLPTLHVQHYNVLTGERVNAPFVRHE
ncbi:MAG: metallophosphoesterase family protein [Anaerolineae bacterium]|nr:metallophosphoesterase family protein [Anaerolineae bacterium]